MVSLHRFVYWAVRPLATAFFKLKFCYSWKMAQGLPERYIVLANHTTDYDPLLVALSFRKHMYFVASEHVARWGFASRLIATFLDPIWRSKGSVGAATVKEVLRRLRDGHNVCLFAEGNRSWDGRTGAILPATGKLVRKAGCGLVTYRLSGGYFVSPRWSRRLRRGPCHGEVVGVYSAEALAAMSVDEINAAIRRDLSEDAYARQLASPKAYKAKGLAEGLEDLLFLCPHCGAHGSLTSRGDRVECGVCGKGFTYTREGFLEGLPCRTLTELAQKQREQAVLDARAGKTYQAAGGRLMTVKNSVVTAVDEGPVSLGPEGFRCGETVIPLADISRLDIHGKRGIVFSAGTEYYELVPEGNGYRFGVLFEAYKEL